MPWIFFGLMVGYGLMSLLFAFLQPPSAVQGLFKVPAIFVFLPVRWVVPVGRIFVGLCSLFLAGFVAVKVMGAP